MDAVNVDLKAFNERFYWKLTGGHLRPVLDTLTYLARETNVWTELTTLLIPGQNDSRHEIDRMTSWVVNELGPDVPMHFTAFHPDWRMLKTAPTPQETLIHAREIAIRNGIRYAYTGNSHNIAGETTYCPGCGGRLIGREWYRLTDWSLTADGACATCGTAVAGRFEARPGTWGRRHFAAA